MVKPGDQGGDCPECGVRMILIGHGNSVMAAYCDGCDLIVSLGADVASIHDYSTTEEPSG